MNLKTLKNLSYAYLMLPIIIFFIGWLKPIFSIILSFFVISAFVIIFINNLKDTENEEIINRKQLIMVSEIILIICITAGQGGFFYQSVDHNYRNAIFRDLINFKWPVYYDFSNTYLDYYFGHWLVPAGIAKIFLPISSEIAWKVGNVLLLLWTTIGVILSFVWVAHLLEKRNTKNVILALFIFIFFSGLDIIGAFFRINPNVITKLHLEWWAVNYQFSSMITQLFWVFNQSTATWLIILMFFYEKRVNNYLLLIILCLTTSPLPFLGAIPLFACNGIYYLYDSIKNKKLKNFFKDVFSIQNMIALICILPVYYWFFSINTVTSENGFHLFKEFLTVIEIYFLIVFWILEVGLYYKCLYSTYKRKPIYWVSLVSLFFIPFFGIGKEHDFSMRASIPSLMICLILVIDFLINKKPEKSKLDDNTCLIIILLAIGCVTPVFEYFRAFSNIIDYKKIDCVADNIVTFSDKDQSKIENFVTSNEENSIFIKYLIKTED